MGSSETENFFYKENIFDKSFERLKNFVKILSLAALIHSGYLVK